MKQMKSLYKYIAVSLMLLTFALPLSAEYIFLNDGSIHRGSIVSEGAGSVTIFTDAKKRMTFRRSDIIRILYTDLTMGKMLVQKKNGESFTAFMVDEDRDSYTFRNELYKNAEFKVPRRDVLFLAERNPSGLKGETDTESIELSWYRPYDKMDKYNIYTKNNKKDKYQLKENSRSNSFTLKKLPSNTRFFIVVTGVDSKGDETPYSNEIEVVTENIKPVKPSGAVYILSSEGVRTVSWKPSIDPDGRVEKYRVYGIDGSEKKLLGETKAEKFAVKGDDRFNKLYAAAVDDKGDESELSRALPAAMNLQIAVYPGMLFPLDKFRDIAGNGYGGLISFSLNDFFINRLSAAFDTGAYYMTGKDLYEKLYKETDYTILCPFMLTLGYRFDFTEKLSVKPYLSGGGAYLYSMYTTLDTVSDEYKDETLSESGPAAGGGIEIMWRLGYSLSLSLRGGAIYLAGAEEGTFAEASAGLAYSFR